MQSSNVPWWPGTLPWLRGTISYQAPARARGRSAMTGIGDAAGEVAARVARGDGLRPVRRPAGSRRPACGRTRARARSISRLWSTSRALSSPSSSRPSCASSVRSRPASRLSSSCFAPGGELVGPGFDRKQVAAGLRRRETAAPAVVAVEAHRLAPPVGLGFLPPQQLGGQLVVAFAQQIGPDFNGFAGNALDRIAAAVDARIDVLDQKSRPGRIARGRPRAAPKSRILR